MLSSHTTDADTMSTTQTPEHAPLRTPDFHLVAIVALAKINPKSAARYTVQIQRQAHFRGGAWECARLGYP